MLVKLSVCFVFSVLLVCFIYTQWGFSTVIVLIVAACKKNRRGIDVTLIPLVLFAFTASLSSPNGEVPQPVDFFLSSNDFGR